MRITDDTYIEMSVEEALELAAKMLDSVRLVRRANVREAYDTRVLVGNTNGVLTYATIRIGDRNV